MLLLIVSSEGSLIREIITGKESIENSTDVALNTTLNRCESDGSVYNSWNTFQKEVNEKVNEIEERAKLNDF